jgi:hypothetical protein
MATCQKQRKKHFLVEQNILLTRFAFSRSRYTDLQPVGMGAFGLVWYAVSPLPFPLRERDKRVRDGELRKNTANGPFL